MWSLLLSSPTPDLITPFVFQPYAHPTSIIGLITLSYNCWFSYPSPGLSPPYHLLSTPEDGGHDLFMFVSQHNMRSFMSTSSLQAIVECLVCLRDYTRHWVYSRERTFSGLRREWCVYDEVGEQQPGVSLSEAVPAMAKVWGLFFKGYRNPLKGWSRDLTWPDLLYWKIILINTIFRRVFISRERVKNTWRRVHSKIQLCLFYPLQSVLSTHTFSVLFIFFVQLKYFQKILKFIQAEYRQWVRGNHTWNRVNSSLFQ